jgi:virginiamycin B lyase
MQRSMGWMAWMASAALMSASAVATATPAGATLATDRWPRVVEFAIPSPGTPEGIAIGPDQGVWFSERYTSQIGRMSPRGRFQILSFDMANHMSTDIAAGSDGAMWFTFPNSVPSYDTGKIGRITVDGHASFIPIPWTSDAESITAGPDGNMWFADHVSSAIGRVTMTGEVTRFPIPGPTGTYPYQIASGPDGALWFTDFNGRRIGRLTTDGEASFVAVPEEDGYPDAITAGPDGNLWFTLDETGRIARLTPVGELTEFPLDVPEGDYAFLSGIAPARDALVFTFQTLETGASRIGRITMRGRVDWMATPTQASSPHAITGGPGGTVWFTEAATGNIGRILGH